MKLNKEQLKRKNELFNSIMSDPKMARVFKEALSSPLGSTKREQAKSTLSIINKMNRSRQDGQGGPIGDFGNSVKNLFGPAQTIPLAPSSTSTSTNYRIFKAAPKLKIQSVPAPVSAPAVEEIPEWKKNLETVTSHWDTSKSPVAPLDLTKPISSKFSPVDTSSKVNTLPEKNNIVNPSSNSNNGFQYSWNGGPFASTTEAAGFPISTSTPSSKQETEKKEEWKPVSLPEKLLNWGIGKALPWVGSAIDKTALSASALAQYLASKAKTTYSQASDVMSGEWERPGYQMPTSTPLKETWGGKLLKNYYDNSDPKSNIFRQPGTETVDTIKKIEESKKQETTDKKDEKIIGTEKQITNTELPKGADVFKGYNFGVLTSGLGRYATDPDYTTKIKNIYTAIPDATVTSAAAIDLYIKGKYPSSPITGEMVLNAAKESGVDPKMLLSGMELESRFGTEGVSAKTFNPANYGNVDSGATNNLGSWANGVSTYAKALVNRMEDLPDGSNIDTTQQTGSKNIGSSYSNITEALAANNGAGVGANTYALGEAEKVFPGGLTAHQIADKKELEADPELKTLEEALSEKLALKENLIPTLKTYFAGKDKNLKYLDTMIEKTKASLPNLDMGNPAVAADYKAQLEGYYYLKGKLESRYTNFLNAATTDYNADVVSLNDRYTKRRTEISNLITEGATLDQNTYNDIITRASALYSDLENAKTRALNQATVYDSYVKTSLGRVASGIQQDTVTNIDFAKDEQEYLKDYGVVNKTGTVDYTELNTAALGTAGLAGLYDKVVNKMNRDHEPLTSALSTLFIQTIRGSSDKTGTINKLKGLVDDLATTGDNGKLIASTLYPALQTGGSAAVSTYFQDNLDVIKTATNDLVNGISGFWVKTHPAGLKDKTAWMARHTDLDKNVLEALYFHAQKSFAVNTNFVNNPTAYVTSLFDGATPQEQAARASQVMFS